MACVNQTIKRGEIINRLMSLTFKRFFSIIIFVSVGVRLILSSIILLWFIFLLSATPTPHKCTRNGIQERRGARSYSSKTNVARTSNDAIVMILWLDIVQRPCFTCSGDVRASANFGRSTVASRGKPSRVQLT